MCTTRAPNKLVLSIFSGELELRKQPIGYKRYEALAGRGTAVGVIVKLKSFRATIDKRENVTYSNNMEILSNMQGKVRERRAERVRACTYFSFTSVFLLRNFRKISTVV